MSQHALLGMHLGPVATAIEDFTWGYAHLPHMIDRAFVSGMGQEQCDERLGSKALVTTEDDEVTLHVQFMIDSFLAVYISERYTSDNRICHKTMIDVRQHPPLVYKIITDGTVERLSQLGPIIDDRFCILGDLPIGDVILQQSPTGALILAPDRWMKVQPAPVIAGWGKTR